MAKEIEALRRGLAVLDLLRGAGPLGLSDLARRAALPKATALRILSTLSAAGHARQRLSDGRWEVCGNSPAAPPPSPHDRIALAAGPVLDRLCAAVLWPSDIGVFERGAIRVLETSRRRSPFVVNRDVMGARIHVMLSAMGRAILAAEDGAGRDRMLADLRRDGDARDRAACTDAAVARIVGETRARGYAMREPGYYVTTPGEGRVSAAAVPVMAKGRPVAAVNLCWVSGAVAADGFETLYLSRLAGAAHEIAEGLET